MTESGLRSLAQRVAEMFPVGHPVPGFSQGVVLDVRHDPDEVVPLVRWGGDERVYGIPIRLVDPRREFYYKRPVESDDEWLDSIGLGVMVMLDTGFRARARRRQVGDYIELRDLGGWPNDDRFYLSSFEENFDEGRANCLRHDGLDPKPALECLKSGTQIAWLVAYENNSTGAPDVGQAVISKDPSGDARLEFLEVAPSVPESVMLDLAYFAAHTAAEKGATVVVTDLDNPLLGVAGFESCEGQQVLDTSFLRADPDRARALLARSLADGGMWGGDRDAAGRYLPSSRLGRLAYLLMRGPSGRRPRKWAG
ncbi:hypothetical protein ASE01_18625 [Nocardioides sp. Root190]|uniref:hypothetical protein n=1 Tax=Nocardioides sp. Root190 TaxID=1736488 RepID=UPI0006F8B7BB|nr:hypothetical protein [Nocardioides sp. Root190]KRB74011.1 hypothetical protein ASE01_18625 [Nocardioides sp. Root190]